MATTREALKPLWWIKPPNPDEDMVSRIDLEDEKPNCVLLDSAEIGIRLLDRNLETAMELWMKGLEYENGESWRIWTPIRGNAELGT